MNSEVLSLILGRFPPSKELLNLRLVNMDWNKIVSKSKSMDGIIFTVDQDKDGEAIKAFRSLPPDLRLKHFRFANQNFEGWAGLLRDPGVSGSFTANHCPRIETIYLLNCNLSSGKFFELLSHCPNLANLHVQDCPSMYYTNMTCLNWTFPFKSLKRNLAGLETLKVSGKFIPEKDLWGLTCEMKSLKRVAIGVNNDGVLLPRHAIINLLRNNCHTLEEVILVGRLLGKNVPTKDMMLLEDFPDMTALKTMTIWRGHFDSIRHTCVLEKLIRLCPNLSELSLADASLEPESLSGTHLEESLTKLDLRDCSFATGVFIESRLIKLEHLKVAQTEGNNTYKGTLDAVKDLLRRQKPRLETLELSLPSGGADCLRCLTPIRFPRLVRLTLDRFSDIQVIQLRGIFKNFAILDSLALTNCRNLVDEVVCAKKGWDAEEFLGNLSRLRQLNLSGTLISNPTIADSITLLYSLECLWLDRTKVDKAGLKVIISAVAVGLLPSLWYVSLEDSACKLSQEEYDAMMEFIAPRYIIICCDLRE